MKRFILSLLVFVIAVGMVSAQAEVGADDPFMIGVDSAQQMLKEVSVDKFEHDGFWYATMSSDEGYVTSRLFFGGPDGKEPVPEEADMDISDDYVFGIRADFLRRGYNSFFVRPLRPIPIEGITKTVSVWAVGRNFNHTITLLIQDYFGRDYEIFMGRLNFQGWKRLTVAIPPQTPSGATGVTQRSYHYPNQMGVRIMGFRIDCDPLEAYGSYYIYFDDLRAITDLFAEHDRDPDDMQDGW
ncbi:MAG: flagellar filament outer layer protein FlaA [Treponema sp.]|nr:flagellar filament outer layer protein FlaA [Treponema sp.]